MVVKTREGAKSRVWYIKHCKNTEVGSTCIIQRSFTRESMRNQESSKVEMQYLGRSLA